jgi:chemotaxis protein MotB
MNRRREEKKKDNLERWLLTYSDLITLLMVFFVVLYSLSSLNVKKYQAVAVSLAQEMGGGGQSVLNDPGVSLAPGVSVNSPVDENITSKDLQELNTLEQLRKELQDYIDQNELNGKVAVTIEERGVVISFQDVALFPLGSAELTADAKEMVGKIGLIIMKTPQYIRVEGHTDNLPINTSLYPSNWELSVARATSVVQELIHSLNFPPYRLSATGYGEFRPRVPNGTEFQHQQNRRVDIVALKSKYETAEPVSTERQ